MPTGHGGMCLSSESLCVHPERPRPNLRADEMKDVVAHRRWHGCARDNSAAQEP